MRPNVTKVAVDIERIVQAEYERGYNDALAQIASVASEKLKPRKSIGEPGRRAREARERFRHGSVMGLTFEYIQSHHGLTGAQIISGLKDETPTIEERTVRTALRRLRVHEQLIKNEEGRWFLK